MSSPQKEEGEGIKEETEEDTSAEWQESWEGNKDDLVGVTQTFNLI